MVEICKYRYNPDMPGEPKDVEWCGRSKEALRELSEDMQDAFGLDLWWVQIGLNPRSMKRLSDGLIELKINDTDNTYRLVYISKFEEAVYVLHVFNKKSHEGGKTPARDAAMIEKGQKEALQKHQAYLDKNVKRNKK
jgi:phage-related protein